LFIKLLNDNKKKRRKSDETIPTVSLQEQALKESQERRDKILKIREELQDWRIYEYIWPLEKSTHGSRKYYTDQDWNDLLEFHSLENSYGQKLEDKEIYEEALESIVSSLFMPHLVDTLAQYRKDKKELYIRSDIDFNDKKFIDKKLHVFHNYHYSCPFCGSNEINDLEIITLSAPERTGWGGIKPEHMIKIEEMSNIGPLIKYFPICKNCLKGNFSQEQISNYRLAKTLRFPSIINGKVFWQR